MAVFSMHINEVEFTVCPESSDPFYKVTYYIKWVTTSWTYCIPLSSVQVDILARLLYLEGLDINKCGVQGNTALMYAAIQVIINIELLHSFNPNSIVVK